MGPSDFVHLHVHSDFSLLDGAAKIDGLVEKAKACGQTALALTDHGTLSGIVSFHKECKKAGIKPILGCEAYVALGDGPDAHRERKTGYNHLTLLAKNEEGWKNLSRLSSISNLEGFYYHPRVSVDLLRRHAQGLIALSGCLKGPVSVPLIQGAPDHARKQAEKFKEIFGDDYYLEIQPNSLDAQKVVNEGCLALARELSVKPVATCDLHYLEPQDAEAQEIRICIASGKTLKDEDRLKMKEDFYFKSSEEMQRAFSHVPEAILSTREIAEKVVEWKLLPGASGQYFLPKFVPEDGSEARAYLRRLATVGLAHRYGDPPAPSLSQRLDYELSVIEKQGLVDYFLIVQDFINWARKNGCPVGPGRGSAAGSIVAYAIGITDIDPIRYDLLFERFLNPDRVSMPDIDVDFCEANRGKVIDYVRRKYGEKNVCQIITFGTLKAKAVIRDVGRVLDVPLAEVDKIAKLVPEGPKTTLESALAESPDLAKLRDEPAYRRLFDLALKLEGINRHEGRHAAGVVIADKDLLERIPLTRVGSGDDKAVATQFTMTEVEEVGLLKMDFLGLRTLTLVHDCLELVKKTTGTTIDENAIPLDDAKTFALLQRGESRGVFQLESSGMRRLLVELRPDRFEDIIALIALFRPGPLESGMAEAFVRRKHGEAVVYEHPTLEPILKDTYGCFVYQEQIMLLAHKVAGFTMSEADVLRKAMGKKKVDLMEKYKPKFVSGCEKTGLEPQKAVTIWDQIAKFAEYGFNKCVAGETELFHADTGERTTVESLFQRKRPFRVHALGDDWKLRPRDVIGVARNGRKPVFELRTAQGKRIVATGNHPFRTLDGWTLLEDLKAGDRIAAPRRLPVATRASWPRHELVVLAGLLSEGNTCHPTCLYFSNRSLPFVVDFANAANAFSETKARIDERRNRPGMFDVCVSTGRNTRFKAGDAPWNKGGVALLERKAVRSGMHRWADQLGILGLKATEKKIPAPVFELRDEDLELFLGRLWSGDGFFANETLFVPFYATSSVELARGVQTMLLRLGIPSGIHEKAFKYRGGTRTGYTVHLLGEGSIRAFVDRVCPHAMGRDEQVGRLRSYVETTKGETSKDTVPAEVRRWVGEDRGDLNWRELERRSGVSTKELVGRGSHVKRGFRRRTVARLASFLGSKRLQDLADSDVFWDRIVSIEPLGERETYDLEVETDHNFVADGLVVHNSHSAAYGLVTYRTAWLKANYPVEFMAATLTSWSGDTDKLVEYVDECQRMDIQLEPPCVSTGIATFDVRQDKKGAKRIVYGLEAIKGVGSGCIAKVLEAREHAGGRFRSIFHFADEVDSHAINRATLEALVKAGAFSKTGARRSQLALVVERALQMGAQTQRDKLSNQTSLFGAASADDEKKLDDELLPQVPEWSDAELLKNEKEALGFYLTKHPLEQHRPTIERFATARTTDLVDVPEGADVTIGGLLVQVKPFLDKKGNTMAFIALEDFSGKVEGVVFGSIWPEVRELVRQDAAVFLQGKLDKRREAPSIKVESVVPLDQAEGKLRIAVDAELLVEETTEEKLLRLRDLLQSNKGDDSVYYTFRRQKDGSTSGPYRISAKVRGTDALKREMLAILGPTAQIQLKATATRGK